MTTTPPAPRPPTCAEQVGGRHMPTTRPQVIRGTTPVMVRVCRLCGARLGR